MENTVSQAMSLLETWAMNPFKPWATVSLAGRSYFGTSQITMPGLRARVAMV